MKQLIPIFIILMLLISCRPNHVKLNIEKTKPNSTIRLAQKKPVEDDSEKDDSTYVIGDFLFTAKKSMVFDLIKRGNRSTKNTIGDTLYQDDKVVLLGDSQKINIFGFYKKFKFKSTFKMFPVDSIYKGKLSTPNFDTDPGSRYYITRIKDGCKDYGVNFAGHYTIVEWECGSACRCMVLVDRISGNIISKIPFDTLDGHSAVKYRIDSKMIIVNTEELKTKNYRLLNWRKPAIYKLENATFVRIE